MKNFIFLFLLFFSLYTVRLQCFFWNNTICAIPGPKRVKVLLDKLDELNDSIVLCADSGFFIQQAKHKKQVIAANTLEIVFHKYGTFINGVLYKTDIIINSLTGVVQFEEKTYSGFFVLKCVDSCVLLINYIDLEEYIYCVLKTEGWPGWPLEINKVLAVVCRTYVLAMIKQAERLKRPYHVTNTHQFQTYHGIHSTPIIAQAVQETRGRIITYNNQPILAMYSSCCGGIIPAGTKNVDHGKAPYLARKYACKYCKKCPSYSWQTTIPIDLFSEKIGYPGKKINSVVVSKKDRAGLAQEISIRGKKIACKITSNKAYSFSGKIQSFCFDTCRRSREIVFKGRGHGHHIGLCQWGAREMVKKGYKLEKILQYYYPKTSFGKIV